MRHGPAEIKGTSGRLSTGKTFSQLWIVKKVTIDPITCDIRKPAQCHCSFLRCSMFAAWLVLFPYKRGQGWRRQGMQVKG